MKRTRILTVLAGVGLLFASTANAATSISLVASGTFTPGSNITLKTFATSNGGETATGVLGNLNYSTAVLTGNAGLNSQVNLGTIGDMLPGWSSNGLICTTVFCTAFNQTKALPAGTAGITNQQIATTVFTINSSVAPGTVITLNWRTTPASQGLTWFGLTQSPGVSVTVVPIPEPTTAALLGLGILGLAVAGRRRA